MRADDERVLIERFRAWGAVQLMRRRYRLYRLLGALLERRAYAPGWERKR